MEWTLKHSNGDRIYTSSSEKIWMWFVSKGEWNVATRLGYWTVKLITESNFYKLYGGFI